MQFALQVIELRVENRSSMKKLKLQCIFWLLFLAVMVHCHKLHAQTITTIAGNGTEGFSGDGFLAINAEFSEPSGVAVDKRGNIYIADDGNDVIHKIDINGIMTRFAGTGSYDYSGDGGPATAAHLQLYIAIIGITVDSIDNVYFADGNVVRKVDTFGIISTVAGNGVDGYSGDGGPATAAKLFTPTGICFDRKGNLYIADEQKNVIRMVNHAGIISTMAGTTIGFSGDGGPATNAQLKWPTGITTDELCNIFFSDFYNDRVREIDTLGIIHTVGGGSPTGDAYCMGCPATDAMLNAPIGIVTDHLGNVYVSDAGDAQIQKITPDGKLYTVVGNGTTGYLGDGGAATAAELNDPTMICFDNSGNLLIADRRNVRVRRVNFGTVSTPVQNLISPHLSVYPNPVLHDQFTCSIFTDTNEQATVQVTNVLGQVAYTSVCTTNGPAVIHLHVAAGLYFITAFTTNGKMQQKLSVQ